MTDTSTDPGLAVRGMLAHALEYAAHGWAVFPLAGKVPAIPKRLGGRGVLDATTDADQITEWWSAYRGANIGARVPDPMFVLDIDPRHGGLESLAALENSYRPLPDTLTTVSGRGDGGRHLFYRRPAGPLSCARLGSGIDIKTSTGYTVVAPSIHPDTGRPYTRVDRPVAAPPSWLIALITPEPKVPTAVRTCMRRSSSLFSAPGSIADDYAENTSWAQILEPHGWTCTTPDPDADGAIWLHPTHTSPCSATVKHGCLFVYSPNTPFQITESSNPNGYTRFRAYAVLNHSGDMSAAARALREPV